MIQRQRLSTLVQFSCIKMSNKKKSITLKFCVIIKYYNDIIEELNQNNFNMMAIFTKGYLHKTKNLNVL